MTRQNFHIIVLLAILGCCCRASKDLVNDDLINSKVQRTVDLTTHLPKITSTITLENNGKSSVNYFLYAVDSSLMEYLSYIGASVKSSDDDSKLTFIETQVEGHPNKHFYRVDLLDDLEAGKHVTIDVDCVYSHSLRPYPSHISQSEKQLVQFNGNVFHYSPYKTTTQTTTVNCGSSTIESHSKVKPVSTSDSTITYGPYENKKAMSTNEMIVHYENNSPFLAVSQMTRLIEVSHWGNIAVEETLDVRHTGSILKGPFSRYDYQRNQDGASSIKSLKTVLPASARDVYYRDEIGNISTSHLREQDDSVELELRPRFPLFGGWKTHYYIGYNVPSYQYLYNSGDQYILKMRFVDHVFDDQVIDRLTLKILLPEGTRNIRLVTPYKVERSDNELYHTYLDTMGRPVITAHKSNLVEQHIQDFELHYSFPKVMLLQEPLLVVCAFYLLFLVVIIYVRLDFSITKDEASESRMRVAGLIEQVQAVHDRRSALYQSYVDAINKYKTSKDSASFTAQRKRIDADHKQLTQQMAGLLTKLKAEGSEYAEKVAELQRLDTPARDHINLELQYAEKLIAGKITKTQYLDLENNVKAKKEDTYQKMDTILAAF